MSVYVAKMVPFGDYGQRCYAFGRVFSGTITKSEKVRILGPDYEYNTKRDLYVKKVGSIGWIGARGYTYEPEPINDCPAGNVCTILNVDQFLLNSGTLTDSNEFYPFRNTFYSAAAKAAVVQVAIDSKSPADLPRLVQGLKRLSQLEPSARVSIDKSGQHILSSAGEFHLNCCLKTLREDYTMRGADINITDPFVLLTETVTMRTGSDLIHPKTCLSKSPNKHNRLYMWATPLQEAFVKGIETGDIPTGKVPDIKVFARDLANKYLWDIGEARKIWTFGCPPDGVANVLVDVTKGVQYLNEIKDYVVGAFMHVTNSGVLCENPLRGVRFNLEDVMLYADAIHRGAGQIIPCARRVCYACQLASGPRLMEPVYLVDIVTPPDVQERVINTLNSKCAGIERIQKYQKTNLVVVRAQLRVMESFEFTALLKQNANGKAVPQMKFSHWGIIPGNPMEEGTHAYHFLMQTRKKKGLKEELPVFSDYCDKLF
ncbi:ef2 [Reticulomyxa filosa]|uniref:Ef2 n=1 Tax=Reticulomyxa filosa TaxID=46433 RepID=X6P290_RETFI|nr:ef2 [Reticulomyxa filosa]|eukprot:ETO32189.1 ef2 [Reticulomyxa filosa]